MWSLTGRLGRLGFFWRTLIGGSMLGAAKMLHVLAQMNGAVTGTMNVLFLVVVAAGGWICIAAFVRRFHDLGWSGWWTCIAILPAAGWVQALVLCVLPGQKGPNRFDAPAAAGDVRAELLREDDSFPVPETAPSSVERDLLPAR